MLMFREICPRDASVPWTFSYYLTDLQEQISHLETTIGSMYSDDKLQQVGVSRVSINCYHGLASVR